MFLVCLLVLSISEHIKTPFTNLSKTWTFHYNCGRHKSVPPDPHFKKCPALRIVNSTVSPAIGFFGVRLHCRGPSCPRSHPSGAREWETQGVKGKIISVRWGAWPCWAGWGFNFSLGPILFPLSLPSIATDRTTPRGYPTQGKSFFEVPVYMNNVI